MIYICLLAGALILGLLLCRNKKGSMIYCIIMGIAMFLVAALRRSVGTDYNNYAHMYMRAMTSDIEEMVFDCTEKGYTMLSKLLADHFSDYQAIFIVCAAFFAVCVAVAAYKYCKRPYLGICFFLAFGLYFNTLNFLRQEIAGFIIFYAIMHCVKKDQFFRFCIFALLASCFHFSALLIIPFYFIMKIKIKPVILGIYAAITALVLIFSWDIMDFITDYVYQSYQPRTSVHMLNGITPIYFIVTVIISVIPFILRKKLVERNPFNDVLISCMFFSLFFEILGLKHSILSRMGIYFSIPAIIVLLPEVFEVIIDICRKAAKQDKKRRTLLTGIAVASLAVICTVEYGMMIANGYNRAAPYKTIFDEVETEAW